MTDRPIIFSAPMILALLDGRKTMTRRLAWRPCKRCNDTGTVGLDHRMDPIQCPACREELLPSPWQRAQPGDRLWVRENFALVGGGDPGVPIYAANWREDARARGFENIPKEAPKWTPSIHMPRWASRITLVVRAAEIERLQAISWDDARAEGLSWVSPTWGIPGLAASWHGNPRHSFAVLWDSINGDGAWNADPEIVAIRFAVHQTNIDRMEQTA